MFDESYVSTNIKEWTHECRFSVQLFIGEATWNQLPQLKLELDLKSHLF